jgi:hypothetical protein
MKKMLLVVAYLFATLVITAQTVNFRNISLDEACSIAKKENKIVMLVLESSTCNQCNEVAIQGLSGSVIKRFTDNSCVIIKKGEQPSELTSSNNLFQLSTVLFGVIYLDGDKNILNIQTSSSSSYSSYLDQIEKALNEKDNTENNIVTLKRNYYNNVNGFSSVIKLVEKIRLLKLEPSELLLDDMMDKAPKDSLESLSFLQFVNECAPLVNSLAQKKLYRNSDNANMAWYRLSREARVAINNRISQKSLDKAIKEKDASYAYAVANTVRSHYQSGSPETVQKMYQSTLLRYYKGIKDSATYVRMALPFYNQYFMPVNVDSIARLDSLQRIRISANVSPLRSEDLDKVLKDLKPSNARITKQFVTTSTNVSPQGQYYCNNLNEAAWTLYTFTKDIGVLNKALIFAKKANEFVVNSEAMDTYARLLYKTGNKSEAINWETKAIASAKLRSISNNSEYEKVLAKMQANETKIDEY